jgi:hypothetical protein
MRFEVLTVQRIRLVTCTQDYIVSTSLYHIYIKLSLRVQIHLLHYENVTDNFLSHLSCLPSVFLFCSSSL